MVVILGYRTLRSIPLRAMFHFQQRIGSPTISLVLLYLSSLITIESQGTVTIGIKLSVWSVP